MNIVRWNNLSTALPMMNQLDDLFDILHKSLKTTFQEIN